MKSPFLDRPGDFEQGNRWVFYDVVGIFTVFYPTNIGQVLNYATAVTVLIVIAYHIAKGFYSIMDLFKALLGHIIAAVVMLGKRFYVKFLTLCTHNHSLYVIFISHIFYLYFILTIYHHLLKLIVNIIYLKK